MKLAVMQPYLFPYIGYFQLISAVDIFIFYDDVDYIKNGWINRNRILINGKPNYFTIPCKNASPNRLIQDIKHLLDDRKKKLLKKIKFTYNKAPFFDSVYPLIERTMGYDSSYIAELAMASIKETCNYLDITPIFKQSSKAYDNTELERTSRLIDICKQENSGTYINLVGGKKLYSKDNFKEADIILKFLEPVLKDYEQFGNDFVPGLSIIDAMMFNAPEKIRNQLFTAYTLV